MNCLDCRARRLFVFAGVLAWTVCLGALTPRPASAAPTPAKGDTDSKVQAAGNAKRAGLDRFPGLLPEGKAPKWRHWMRLDAVMGAQLRANAQSAYEANNLELAVALFPLVLDFSPDDLEAMGRLGFALKEIGRYEDALEALRRAAGANPGEFQYQWWLGDTQRMLGQYDEAVLSMTSARDLAPADRRDEMQLYVVFSQGLASKEKSWEHFNQHVQLAIRHEGQRRTRRCIAEYLEAIAVTPDQGDEKNVRPLRLGLAYTNIATQYTYMKEPDAAITYLDHAMRLFDEGKERNWVMRTNQAYAVAYRMIAMQAYADKTALFAKAASYWEASATIAKELQDPEYERFARGSMLRELCEAVALDDPKLVEVRAANQKEMPFKGPINEYSTAAVTAGEAACRIKEGDWAGARTAIEMVAPYYENTQFLVDSEEAARLFTMLSDAYFNQGHFKQAIETGRRATQRVISYKRFLSAESYNRSDAETILRRGVSSVLRAQVQNKDAKGAQDDMEQYHALTQGDILGDKVRDESRYTDAGTEELLLRARIAMAEADGADAKAKGEKETAARLERGLVQDRKRLAWLERKLALPNPKSLSILPIRTLKADEVRAILPPESALLSYVFGAKGGVALVATKDTVEGVSLDNVSEAELYALIAAFRKAAASDVKAAEDALGKLHALLIDPVLPQLKAKTLYIAPDEVLNYLPFEALHKDGHALIEDFEIVYAASGSYLNAALNEERAGKAALRAVVPDAAFAKTLEPAFAGFGAAEKFVGAEATESKAVEDAEYNVLHLAAKADLSAADPMLGALILGKDAANDGALHAAEWLGVQSHASLIVLDLDLDRDPAAIRGTELNAFTEGLTRARVPSFLIDLWTPAPGERAAFFTGFYKNLATQGRGAALRQAKLELRKQNPGSLAWAAYVLRGDSR